MAKLFKNKLFQKLRQVTTRQQLEPGRRTSSLPHKLLSPTSTVASGPPPAAKPAADLVPNPFTLQQLHRDGRISDEDWRTYLLDRTGQYTPPIQPTK